jgi:hypothetical protein
VQPININYNTHFPVLIVVFQTKNRNKSDIVEMHRMLQICNNPHPDYNCDLFVELLVKVNTSAIKKNNNYSIFIPIAAI